MKKLILLLFLCSTALVVNAQTYCTTNLYTNGCSFNDDINDFSIGSFTQVATGCSAGAYADYTNLTIQITQSPSTWVPFSVGTSYSSGEYVGLWMDWNSDGDFDDTTEFLHGSTVSFGNAAPYVDSLLFDNSVPVGTFRMRVRVIWNTAPLASNSCTSFGYGETHDYNVTILPDVVGGCVAFTNFDIDSVTAFGAKVNWTPGAGNTSFYLEYGVTGFPPGTGTKITGTLPGTQPPVILSGLQANTPYDVYFGEICNSGNDTAYFAYPRNFHTTVTCPPPFGLVSNGTTGTTGDVSWNTINGTNFILEWGPVGFVQGTGTQGTAFNDTNFIMTGLTPLTTYDVYVADSCAPTDQSTFAGPLTITTGCNGSLSGVYTLDASQPYSSTNFVSFSQLALAFELCGVSGPVTVNVAAGSSYNAQIEFDTIVGASSVNTVIINGNGATLSYLSTETNQRATLTLNGTDWLTIDSLNVKALGSASGEYGYGIVLINDADHNVIRNCTVTSDTSSTSSSFAGIAITGATNSATSTSGPTGNYNLIENNIIIGGYYGLTAMGESSDSANSNILRNNIIRDYRYYGLYAYYNNGLVIEDNDISRPFRTNLTTSYGLYSYGLTSGRVVGNRIHDPFAQDETVTSSAYGLYMGQYDGTASNPTVVANNMIYNFNSNGTIYGLYPSSINYTKVIHNTVVIDDDLSTATGLTRVAYLTGTMSNSEISNNMLYLNRPLSTGANYLVYSSGSITTTTQMRGNAYYGTSSTMYDFGYSGSAISTFSDWKASTGLDVSSIFNDPYFVDIANDDYTPQASVFDGLGADFSAYITTDITGATRNTPPDPGAIEFTGAPCTGLSGIGVTAITSSSGTIVWEQDPASVTIEWGPEGFKQASITGTIVNVPTGDTSSVLSGLSPKTCYDYYITQNCTSTIPGAPPVIGPLKFCTECIIPGLTGTYTIGGSPGPNNFATLDSAVAVMNSCGVIGPVVFNMNGGTHNAVTIGQVSGMSATNTVTFNGSSGMGDSIIAVGQTAALDLDGASYMIFNDIYMANNSGYVVWFHTNANHIEINDCDIVSDVTTSSSSVAAIVASNSATSATSAGDNANHITISGCSIKGGYYGITFYGPSSTAHGKHISVINNDMEDQYYYGIRLYYMDSLSVQNNTIPTLRNTFSYGLYLYYADIVDITGNYVGDAGTYGMYAYYINRYAASNAASTSVIANNMLHGGTAGIYSYGNQFVDYHHNTAQGGTYGMYLSGSSPYSDIDIRNNIFVNDGTNRALYISTEPDSNLTLDYNLYYSPNGDVAYHNAVAYATLAAWQTAEPAFNMNSVSGDPLFVGPTDFHVLGALANDVGDNSVGITVDIDGDPRPASGSTVVDMGADEYTPVTEDLAIFNGMFKKDGRCLSTTDTIILQVYNSIGSTADFSTTPLVANYTVTGPVNSTGTITVNTGTLAYMDTLDMMATTIDLSIPGVYTLNAYIDPNADNLSALNDTLISSANITVYPVWEVNPDTVVTITNGTDTVEIEAKSPFFGGGDFFITEVCQFQYTTGAPTAGWPSYLVANDYIEITGVPGSDLGGITLEQWSTSSLMNTYTFPQGTLLSPNGTAIIAVGEPGSSVPSPSDFYYHGDVSTTFSSGGSNGRILKDASGVIIDAVAYGSSYAFPVSSGVTAADWSGTVPSSTSTSGIRLEGPDANNSTNWLVSSSSPQDPNTVNSNVPVPAPGSVQGFSWTLNGNTIDTLPNTVVGPYTSSGVYNYIASYTSPCGTHVDTVVVHVLLGCNIASNLSANVITCDSVELSWTGATDSALVAYAATGSIPTAATLVTGGDSTLTITGTTVSTSYDFYVSNICNGDTLAPVGPFTFNTGTAGAPVASFVTTPGAGLLVNFDASGSTGMNNSYSWDFGDGNTGTGENTTNTYATGGSYSIILTVSNACGTDDTTITLANVSIGENQLSRSLVVYPNPSSDVVNISFTLAGSGDVSIRVMDLSGKEVIRMNEESHNDKYEGTLDVSKLADGVYMLEITNGELKTVTRLIRD